jgi:hypothetical protein
MAITVPSQPPKTSPPRRSPTICAATIPHFATRRRMCLISPDLHITVDAYSGFRGNLRYRLWLLKMGLTPMCARVH